MTSSIQDLMLRLPGTSILEKKLLHSMKANHSEHLFSVPLQTISMGGEYITCVGGWLL